MENKLIVSISPIRMDLGQIAGDKQIDFKFEVTNNSDMTLDLIPWASCGCTTPQVVPSRVAPGAVAELRATFNPQGKTGLQEKALGVNYFISGDQRSSGVTFIAKI